MACRCRRWLPFPGALPPWRLSPSTGATLTLLTRFHPATGSMRLTDAARVAPIPAEAVTAWGLDPLVAAGPAASAEAAAGTAAASPAATPIPCASAVAGRIAVAGSPLPPSSAGASPPGPSGRPPARRCCHCHCDGGRDGQAASPSLPPLAVAFVPILGGRPGGGDPLPGGGVATSCWPPPLSLPSSGCGGVVCGGCGLPARGWPPVGPRLSPPSPLLLPLRPSRRGWSWRRGAVVGVVPPPDPMVEGGLRLAGGGGGEPTAATGGGGLSSDEMALVFSLDGPACAVGEPATGRGGGHPTGRDAPPSYHRGSTTAAVSAPPPEPVGVLPPPAPSPYPPPRPLSAAAAAAERARAPPPPAPLMPLRTTSRRRAAGAARRDHPRVGGRPSPPPYVAAVAADVAAVVTAAGLPPGTLPPRTVLRQLDPTVANRVATVPGGGFRRVAAILGWDVAEAPPARRRPRRGGGGWVGGGSVPRPQALRQPTLPSSQPPSPLSGTPVTPSARGAMDATTAATTGTPAAAPAWWTDTPTARSVVNEILASPAATRLGLAPGVLPRARELREAGRADVVAAAAAAGEPAAAAAGRLGLVSYDAYASAAETAALVTALAAVAAASGGGVPSVAALRARGWAELARAVGRAGGIRALRARFQLCPPASPLGSAAAAGRGGGRGRGGGGGGGDRGGGGDNSRIRDSGSSGGGGGGDVDGGGAAPQAPLPLGLAADALQLARRAAVAGTGGALALPSPAWLRAAGAAELADGLAAAGGHAWAAAALGLAPAADAAAEATATAAWERQEAAAQKARGG